MLDGLQKEQGYSPGATESTRSVKQMWFNWHTDKFTLCNLPRQSPKLNAHGSGSWEAIR